MIASLVLLAYVAVAVGVVFFMLREVRRPSRGLGRLVLGMMNRSHSALTDWGLSHVPIESDFVVLDVGCGGGRTIQKLAGVASTVCGVDFSAGSVAASRAKNASLVASGRVSVVQGSVSSLPFEDQKFDLVTAIETQYYWPDPVNDMREILRVLKPGGKLLVIAETYKDSAKGRTEEPLMRLVQGKNYGIAEQRGFFESSGYQAVEVFEQPSKGWICVVGQKPA